MQNDSSPIGVIGLGRSGSAVVRFLSAHQSRVYAWDANPAALAPLASLPGVTPLAGNTPPESLAACRAILLSPG
ncbi:MAG: UDP-N-acetylmuramoyl-L-alanine--D-glutamate ligase, partial [Magnetococcales bacterium]|nr:UDP-N-acetylmuramoyl-L-alanine--D-glutamate ligase [Magnetococcales bacterium]